MQYLDNDPVEPAINNVLCAEEKLHQSYWFVNLSDGQRAYSKHDQRSWLQLKEWLKANAHVYIVGLYFGFRDNTICVHSGEADYFFTNAVSCWSDGPTQYYFVGGYKDNEVVKCKKYRLPEVYLQEEEERTLDDLSVMKGLIERP